MKEGTADREGFAAFLLRLRGKGLTSKSMVAAFETVPRRAFLPERFASHAWTERMLPIECGEAIEGVDLEAAVIAHLGIEPGHRVLEIGTGTGYTAAVMARLASRVLTLERWRTLADLAKSRMEALAIGNVEIKHMDGSHGAAPGDGPFDRIVVWSATETVPRPFIDQLATHGTTIVVVGEAESEQMLTKLVKVGSRFDTLELGPVRLQKMMRGVSSYL
ncbi:MAG: protein-L-isoaspartate(D-aspartate) O-methyltransferase [Mesorhizobium amorphae]|nr:MAG: protein-L-isoaspartate(D-aspartate) O-methyltransferase [Mesorhizobium amorphae]